MMFLSIFSFFQAIVFSHSTNSVECVLLFIDLQQNDMFVCLFG